MRCPACGGPSRGQGECLRCLRAAETARRGGSPTCPVCDAFDCQGHEEAPAPADAYQEKMAEAAEEERAASGALADDLRLLAETMERVAALAGELYYPGIQKWAASNAEDARRFLRHVK